MRRLFFLITVVLLVFTGCAQSSDSLEPGLELRNELLNGNGCRFIAEVRADFGDMEYTFSATCETDDQGSLRFQVLTPEPISGIEGLIEQETGKLTFDDTVLSFPLLAEGELSPVSAPWVFYKALVGGYLRMAGRDENYTRLTINDSFRSENLTVEVWLDGVDPSLAEIVWRGRSILFLTIREFEIL